MPVSQNGWPALDTAPAFKSTWITGRLLPGDVAYILEHLAARFDAEVERINLGEKVDDDWGWAPRLIKGSTTTLSNHASGTAIDLNATAHPLGKAGTFTAAQVAAIRKILATLDGVIRWGGDYARKDEMHFEINATPQSGRVGTLAAKLRAEQIVPVQGPLPGGGLGTQPTLSFGSKRAEVGALQTKLKQLGYYKGRIDNEFGRITESAVRAYQRAHGLKDDGLVGTETWGALNATTK